MKNLITPKSLLTVPTMMVCAVLVLLGYAADAMFGEYVLSIFFQLFISTLILIGLYFDVKHYQIEDFDFWEERRVNSPSMFVFDIMMIVVMSYVIIATSASIFSATLVAILLVMNLVSEVFFYRKKKRITGA